MNLFTNRLTAPVLGGTARAAWLRLSVGALAAAAAAFGLYPSGASADTVASARAQAQAISARLASLDAQMAHQDEALDQAEIRAHAASARVVAARAALAQAEAQVAHNRDALRHQAVLDYVQGGQSANLQALIQSSEATAGLRQQYINSVANAEQDAIDSLRGAMVTLAQRQSTLEAEQTAAQADLNQVEAARRASAQAAAAETAELSQVRGRLADLVAADQAAAQVSAQRRIQADSASFGAERFNGPPPPQGAGAATAVAWARQELNKPYVYGAAGPDSFDCSGLTMYVWAHAGASLPHSAAGQWDDTTRVPMSDIQPGDLVFFYQPVDHVGIYVGGGQMIIARHTGTVVQYQSIYQEGLDGAGRVE